MKIIHLAAELSPHVKVGGLGDVLQGLASELARLGHEVEVLLPAYSHLQPSLFAALPYKVTLVAAPGFDRGHIYGYEDDAVRFAHYTAAACQRIAGRKHAIIHAHDWHTAAAAALVPNVLLTLHNLAYAGWCSPSLLETIGLSADPRYQGTEGYSLLRVGLLHAKKITTVSPTYAKEILSPPQCETFLDLLQQSQDKLTGILNGIDTHYWDPTSDPHLPSPYDVNHLVGKQITQQRLLDRLGVVRGEGPVVAAITRLVPQKGPLLIEAALEWTLERGGTFLLLGSVGDPKMEKRFSRFIPNKRALIELSFHEGLSHAIYGAADLVVVPSLFEPCGLTQLIAMRYGALPLVRKTGGLADTVQEGETGFVFEPFDPTALCAKLEEAFALWKKDPSEWRRRQQIAMGTDRSWKGAAQAYLELYTEMLKSVKGG